MSGGSSIWGLPYTSKEEFMSICFNEWNRKFEWIVERHEIISRDFYM